MKLRCEESGMRGGGIEARSGGKSLQRGVMIYTASYFMEVLGCQCELHETLYNAVK